MNCQETSILFCLLRNSFVNLTKLISLMGSALWFLSDNLSKNTPVPALNPASPVMQAMNSSPGLLLVTKYSPTPTSSPATAYLSKNSHKQILG